MVANSFRDLPEIPRNGLIGFPHTFSSDAWSTAWSTYCVGGTCAGIKHDFYNSLRMVIPATIISTAIGAVNGYVLSKWRFSGSELIFGAMTLGVFMPGQMTLLPWAFVLGKLGLTNTIAALVLIHYRAGPLLHDALLPQLLRQRPRRPGQGGTHRRRRVLAHLPQDHPAAVAADPDRHGDLAVHRHLERVPVRGDLLLRRQQPITAALIALSAGGTTVRQLNV